MTMSPTCPYWLRFIFGVLFMLTSVLARSTNSTAALSPSNCASGSTPSAPSVWSVVETATTVTIVAGLAAFCRIRLRANAANHGPYKHI
ncbi:membrane-associated protein, putative [Bodo saltans]|uniref:Membrane-associated protein, putative n=1 Tax=Bodo saltans TaxID=75058 RepID=A0A0S4JYS1_BODSA|nr:membrane-associated protein, putative [Bodo saltans]|eukprot:CUG94289.1 membrane-associated protein, putative [Bodo saltans]